MVCGVGACAYYKGNYHGHGAALGDITSWACVGQYYAAVCECVKSCACDAEHDIDADSVCGGVNLCADADVEDPDSRVTCRHVGACDNSGEAAGKDTDAGLSDIDWCASDAGRDKGFDVVCGHVDSCAYDAENDADSDAVCGDLDSCACGGENDQDSGGDVDSCAYDGDNNMFCDEADSSSSDAVNDADSYSTCGGEDKCLYDADDDADGDTVCTDVYSLNVTPVMQSNNDKAVCMRVDLCEYDAQHDADAHNSGAPNDPDYDVNALMFLLLRGYCVRRTDRQYRRRLRRRARPAHHGTWTHLFHAILTCAAAIALLCTHFQLPCVLVAVVSASMSLHAHSVRYLRRQWRKRQRLSRRGARRRMQPRSSSATDRSDFRAEHHCSREVRTRTTATLLFCLVMCCFISLMSGADGFFFYELYELYTSSCSSAGTPVCSSADASATPSTSTLPTPSTSTTSGTKSTNGAATSSAKTARAHDVDTCGCLRLLQQDCIFRSS